MNAGFFYWEGDAGMIFIVGHLLRSGDISVPLLSVLNYHILLGNHKKNASITYSESGCE